MEAREGRPSEDGSYDVPETFLNLDENRASDPAPKYKFTQFWRPSQDTTHTSESQTRDFASQSSEPPPPPPLEPQEPLEDKRRRVTSARPDSEAVPHNFNPHRHTTTASNISELTSLPQLTSEPLSVLDEEKSANGEESIWKSPRHKQVSRLATYLYTISYLIFFSILGTLARLGLQALTFYPGAPVSQGVVWANFGGSLILGFLAEDRKIFQQEWGKKKERSNRSKRLSWWRRDRELVNNSVPYNSTPKMHTPFTSAHTASLYPVQQIDSMPRARAKRESDLHPPPSLLSNNSISEYALTEEKKRHSGVKKTIPLYIGLSVGFCGSFTSFSSYQRDVFLALSDSAPTPGFPTPPSRSGGYSFLALLATLILTPTLALGALQCGAHLAIALDRWTPTFSFSFTRKILDPLVVVLAWLAWIGAIVMAVMPPDRPGGPAGVSTWDLEHWRGNALFALVFAPLGCLARFYLSLLLNSRIPSFPMGTFTVNILGTLLEAGLFDVQHRPLSTAAGMIGGGRVGCQLLQGVMDGFCGCLTTVSTWVAELNGLRRGHAYFYGAASLVVGLVSTLVVMGPVRWGVGFEGTACGA